MRSLYKRLKSNTRFEVTILGIYFMVSLITFILDAINPNCLVTKLQKDFIMPICSSFIFFLLGKITTEDDEILQKINKH